MLLHHLVEIDDPPLARQNIDTSMPGPDARSPLTQTLDIPLAPLKCHVAAMWAVRSLLSKHIAMTSRASTGKISSVSHSS